MKKNKKRRRDTRYPSPHQGLLDAFTEQQLNSWIRDGDLLQLLADKVYFELERQRASKYDDLCDALRSSVAISVDLSHWVRVTDWRWSQTPLSSAGSVKGIGGRFNIGETLDRARGQAFPCLYLAETVHTAYAEYFGQSPSISLGGLTLGELSLRRDTSFTTFLLHGRLERVLDLRDDRAIKGFSDIIRLFKLSSATRGAIRTAGLPPRTLVRSSKQLWNRILVTPSVWRQEPTLFAIPSACQTFGRLARDADFEAILYPSQRTSGQCLAVFTENMSGDSKIEVVGPAPPGASQIVLGGGTTR